MMMDGYILLPELHILGLNFLYLAYSKFNLNDMKALLISLALLCVAPVNTCEEYEAYILAVYDGDTVTADLELGFNISIIEKIRLYGIDAPEIRGSERPEGLIAKQALLDLIGNKEVVIINHGRGKYGRVIGEIILDDTLNVSDWMVRNGYAVYKDY
jgi:micrococcal nuclease